MCPLDRAKAGKHVEMVVEVALTDIQAGQELTFVKAGRCLPIRDCISERFRLWDARPRPVVADEVALAEGPPSRTALRRLAVPPIDVVDR